MALTIPSAIPARSPHGSLAVVRRWAVRLALAIVLALAALLAFGALSAAAPMAHTTTGSITPHAWCSGVSLPC
ncbi:MAG TPA: hypothetical protein VFY89_06265 [Ktedonobacterales bacterium]